MIYEDYRHFRIGEPVEEKVRVIVGNETTTGHQASYILSGKLLCDNSPYFANTISKSHFDGTVVLDHISSKDFGTFILLCSSIFFRVF